MPKCKSTILVTRGAGFIGSHTVVEPINSDYEVIIVDNLFNSELSVIPAIETIIGRSINFIKGDCWDSK